MDTSSVSCIVKVATSTGSTIVRSSRSATKGGADSRRGSGVACRRSWMPCATRSAAIGFGGAGRRGGGGVRAPGVARCASRCVVGRDSDGAGCTARARSRRTRRRLRRRRPARSAPTTRASRSGSYPFAGEGTDGEQCGPGDRLVWVRAGGSLSCRGPVAVRPTLRRRGGRARRGVVITLTP